MAENNELDIVGTCREVLLALLSGKAPEEALLTLTGSGISEEDAQALVNVTIACAQEVSPVIEGGAVMWQAIDALVEQDFDGFGDVRFGIDGDDLAGHDILSCTHCFHSFRAVGR